MKGFRFIRFVTKPSLESAVETAENLKIRHWYRFEEKRFWILMFCTNRKFWEHGRNMK